MSFYFLCKKPEKTGVQNLLKAKLNYQRQHQQLHQQVDMTSQVPQSLLQTKFIVIRSKCIFGNFLYCSYCTCFYLLQKKKTE